MKYKAVIFDFDYTLGDSTKGIVESVNYGLTQLGYEMAQVGAIRRTVGLTLQDTFKKLTDCKDDVRAEQFATYFKQRADLVMTASTDLLPYALETLQLLKSEGTLTGIVTTKLHDRITKILEKFQASSYIDFIIGADDVRVEKPSPEGLLYMINQMNVTKEQVVYVGDSLVDAKTAQNAEVAFVGTLTGATSASEFLDYPYHKIIMNLSELGHVIM